MQEQVPASALPPGTPDHRSILFLVRSMGIGGAERQLAVLAKGLRARGHRVIVACFYGGGPLEAELMDSGVRIIDLGKRGRWDAPRFIRTLVALIRHERPAVIHSYLTVPNVLAAMLRPWSRNARIVWGVRASDMDLSRYGLVDRLVFIVSRAAARYADLIIANSWAGAEYHIAHGYPKARTRVIPNGIDTDRFHIDAEWRRTVRQEWGVADDVPLVGMVARLDPMKGYEVFLAAIDIARRRVPTLRALLVGDGPPEYRAALHALAHELALDDVVAWAGVRRDAPAIYNALDLLCSASIFGEGFSNAVGEALACGVRCVVTDVGDSPRLVGDSTLVAPPGDAESLARCIVSALQPANGTAPQALRTRVIEQFGVVRMLDSSEALLFGAL